MAQSVHVNGEAMVKTGSGASSALELLAVSEDGVDITLHDHTEPVYTDSFGPAVPFEEQQFLQTATIRLKAVFYDEAVFAKIRSRTATAGGLMGAAGALWGSGGFYFRLLITSPIDATPWNFLKARMLDGMSHKIGTKRTGIECSFFAVPYSGVAGSTVGNVLFNAVAT